MIDESIYPPGIILFLTKLLDLATCDSNWRSLLPFGMADPPTGWFSFKIGDAVSKFPPLLTYDEYLVTTQSTMGVEAAAWWSPQNAQSLFDFAFRTPTTVLGDLTTYTSMGVLLVLALTLRRIKSRLLPIFSAYGRRAGRATHGVEWERANEDRIKKFGEYVFRLLFHTLVSVYGVWYFHDKPWWDLSSEDGGTKLIYIGHDCCREGHPIEAGMAWYYLVQCAYNLEAMASLLQLSFVATVQWPLRFIASGNDGKVHGTIQPQSPLVIRWSPTVRGDFREMFVHHVVTNLLIVGSSYFRFTRIGSMVFLVHDVSDVPVDLSKLANFLKWKKATTVCFATMVVVWLLTRLTILPFVIYRSILFESYLMVTANGLDPIYYYCYRPIFYALIGLIILLHLAWFVMFVRMGWLLVSRGEAHDLSEHKKGEDQLLPKKQQQEAASNVKGKKD